MNHGWQSESTDESKGVGSVLFGVVTMFAVLTSPQLLDVAWWSAVVAVVVVVMYSNGSCKL